MTRSFMKRSGESVYGIQELVRAVLWVVLAIALVLLVPVLSHIVAYPLHAFEPMRIALFWVILLLPEKKWNALMLAALLPMISFVVSGHPLFPKNIVMSGELVINVVLLYWILAKTGSYSLSVLLSMVASKVIYYVVKYLLIYLLVEVLQVLHLQNL